MKVGVYITAETGATWSAMMMHISQEGTNKLKTSLWE